MRACADTKQIGTVLSVSLKLRRTHSHSEYAKGGHRADIGHSIRGIFSYSMMVQTNDLQLPAASLAHLSSYMFPLTRVHSLKSCPFFQLPDPSSYASCTWSA
eukprot:6210400-Pleurochrysis_carterae.AAC.4